MARYTGPKTKVSRRYGVPLFGPAKALERKNYPPGMHGPKGSRRKQSDYAIALFRTKVVPDKKHEGLSQFLVDLKSEGIGIRPIIDLAGGKAVRLRGGSANTARGAASFAAEAIGAARSCGCTGTIVTRADSGFYNAAFIAACRRAGAYFSVTARMDPAVTAAIAAIPEDAWTAIRYPRAIWDDQLRAWISDAEIAEIAYTAFTSKKGQAITARLIVRRVRDLAKTAEGQGELFPAWRYHPVFTDSPFELVQAEGQHRDHAVAAHRRWDAIRSPSSATWLQASTSSTGSTSGSRRLTTSWAMVSR